MDHLLLHFAAFGSLESGIALRQYVHPHPEPGALGTIEVALDIENDHITQVQATFRNPSETRELGYLEPGIPNKWDREIRVGEYHLDVDDIPNIELVFKWFDAKILLEILRLLHQTCGKDKKFSQIPIVCVLAG